MKNQIWHDFDLDFHHNEWCECRNSQEREIYNQIFDMIFGTSSLFPMTENINICIDQLKLELLYNDFN